VITAIEQQNEMLRNELDTLHCQAYLSFTGGFGSWFCFRIPEVVYIIWEMLCMLLMTLSGSNTEHFLSRILGCDAV
jgi:hypothetical protein